MSSLTPILESQWLIASVAFISLLALVLALRAMVTVRQLRKSLEELRRIETNAIKQRQLMQESLQGLGRQILQQDERLLQQGQAGSSSVQPSDGSQQVLAMLEAGCSVAEIAGDTGLEEVEVALLQQIHGLRRQASTSSE